MSAVLDVAQAIVNLGLGSLTSTPPTVCVDTLNDTPDNVIGVFQYGGPPPEMVLTDAVAFEYISIQVQARHTDPATAESNVYSIWKNLPPALRGTTINTHKYNFCMRQGYPQMLRVDDDRRTIYYCEFTVWREPE